MYILYVHSANSSFPHSSKLPIFYYTSCSTTITPSLWLALRKPVHPALSSQSVKYSSPRHVLSSSIFSFLRTSSYLFLCLSAACVDFLSLSLSLSRTHSRNTLRRSFAGRWALFGGLFSFPASPALSRIFGLPSIDCIQTKILEFFNSNEIPLSFSFICFDRIEETWESHCLRFTFKAVLYSLENKKKLTQTFDVKVSSVSIV